QDCVHVVERLEPKVREMLRDGRLTLVQARELATIGGVDQLEVAEEVAGELEEALDVRRDRGLVGGRRMTRDEIRGLIANRQQSLKVVPWKLELPMKTGVPGCETCRGCKFNTATDNVLFDMGQQDGKDGAGFCRLPAGFEAKQKLAQKVQVTMVKEVREKIKKKQVEKADAASAAVVRQVAPSFMKEASIQRVLKKELGAGEGKTPAAKPEKKPETPAERREAARWKWAEAYNSWIQNLEQKFDKHVAADPFRKLAWIMLAHGRVAIPRFDANNPGKDGWPAEEKLIGPAASRLLVLANGVASGLLHKEEIKELAGEIDYPQENWWDVQECCSLQAMGPVMVKSFVKAFGFELPSAPPRFEDFLPEDLRPPEPVIKAAPAPSVKPSPAGPKALCDPGQLLAHKRHKIVAESIGMASNLEVSVRLADGKETRWAVGEVRKPTEADAIRYSDSLQPAPLGGGG
ncbi:MAG TPA: hypothetical protein VHM90_00505, partial [Phycisphaerae bacterium]|nr:hypothetical protein [Phycisphaerae bacterium]